MDICVECGEVLVSEAEDDSQSQPLLADGARGGGGGGGPGAVAVVASGIASTRMAAAVLAGRDQAAASGAPSSLYVDYGEGNIRLARCRACGCVADKYIEQELALLCIDIVLHRGAAFRHLFFNRRPLFFGISSIELLVLVISASVLLKLSALFGVEHIRSDFEARPVASVAVLAASCAAEHAAFALPLLIGLGALKMISGKRKESLAGLRLYYAIAFAEVGKLFALFLRVWEAGPEVLFLLAVLMMSLQAASVRVCIPAPELRHRLLPALACAVVCRVLARLCFHTVSETIAMGTIL